MLKTFLIRVLLKLLLKDLHVQGLTDEQKRSQLSLMYQNPAYRTIMQEREQYLINSGINKVIDDKLNDTRGFAGQIIEVRYMLNLTKACYQHSLKDRKERKLKEVPK